MNDDGSQLIISMERDRAYGLGASFKCHQLKLGKKVSDAIVSGDSIACFTENGGIVLSEKGYLFHKSAANVKTQLCEGHLPKSSLDGKLVLFARKIDPDHLRQQWSVIDLHTKEVILIGECDALGFSSDCEGVLAHSQDYSSSLMRFSLQSKKWKRLCGYAGYPAWISMSPGGTALICSGSPQTLITYIKERDEDLAELWPVRE